jgi:hypothetical protein
MRPARLSEMRRERVNWLDPVSRKRPFLCLSVSMAILRYEKRPWGALRLVKDHAVGESGKVAFRVVLHGPHFLWVVEGNIWNVRV